MPISRVIATVCNYNGAAYLVDCLEALGRQTRPPAAIVVYDNGSTDDSVALVKARFPGVQLVEMGKNLGPCPARNRALREADTDWVLQLDSDVILGEDCLERLLAEAEALPGCAILMPRAVFDHDRARIHYDGGYFHYVGVMTLRNFFRPAPDEAEGPVDVDAAIAMALLLRRDRVLAAGGYHAGYFILFEDHDLSYRLRATGQRIRLVPAAVVYHREGTAGISFREGPSYPGQRAFLHSRNRWMLLVRNHSIGALLFGMPGILAYELTWMLFAARKGNLGAYLTGKLAFLRMLPALLRERREIQRLRSVGDRELLRSLPLTHAPMVSQSRLAHRLESLLDRALRGWWLLVRGCVP